MREGRFEIKYDEEYDILFIYNPARRSSNGIEWGSIDLSFDRNGKLANLSLMNASELLSNLTKKAISKEALNEITKCTINEVEKAGILYVFFKLESKNKAVQPIEDKLTVKAMNYHSQALKSKAYCTN